MIWAARSRASVRFDTAAPRRSTNMSSAWEQWKYTWTTHASCGKRFGHNASIASTRGEKHCGQSRKGIYGESVCAWPQAVLSREGELRLDGAAEAWNSLLRTEIWGPAVNCLTFWSDRRNRCLFAIVLFGAVLRLTSPGWSEPVRKSGYAIG